MEEIIKAAKFSVSGFWWRNNVFKETLNKSRLKAVCTSCLHIFRQLAQKILVMRQHYCGLFVQPDKKSDVAICTNDLISVSLSEKTLSVSVGVIVLAEKC